MKEIEAYRRLTEILNKLQPYAIDLSLERIKSFLNKIGNPQDSFKSVIIGGTNGKGTLSQFLSDAFLARNIKTGTYTSPHLIDLNERFRINNKPASYCRLLDVALKIGRINSVNLTYFEFLTAVAFELFKQEKIEVAVLEVGMGGEFDATNVVNPMVSVITRISSDHTEHLGNTLETIAKTKSKIIKNVGVVGKNSKKVTDEIRRNTSAKLFFVDESHLNKAKRIKTMMQGTATKENIATALLTIEVLNKLYDYNLDYKAIENSFWQGRFEVIRTKNKTFILDGAHNKSATLKLVLSLKDFDNKILIFSALKSKDWKNNLKLLSPHFKKIILTPIAEHRLSEDVHNIKNAIAKQNIVIIAKNVNDAIIKAMEHKENTIVITGSLYLIGEAKACKIHKKFLP